MFKVTPKTVLTCQYIFLLVVHIVLKFLQTPSTGYNLLCIITADLWVMMELIRYVVSFSIKAILCAVEFIDVFRSMVS